LGWSSKLGIREDELIFVIMFWCSHNVIYYGWSLPFAWAYKKDYMKYWKVQPNKSPNEDLISETSKVQLFLRVFIHPFVWLLMYKHIIDQKWDDTLPSFRVCVLQVVLCFYVFFVVNSVVHKWMHVYPFIYRYHKDHHAFITTTGIAAEHHHILDSVANALPTFLPTYLMKLHPKLYCVYMFLRAWESVDSHNGYALPFTPFRYLPGLAYQQEYHCFHHHANLGTYSCLCFDHLTGADEPFLKRYNMNFLAAITYGWLGGKHH
jgi:sterol desaturase/sphingolipid hydroxylase (fatty acid hydroxylase superfamily)